MEVNYSERMLGKDYGIDNRRMSIEEAIALARGATSISDDTYHVSEKDAA